MVGCPAAQSLLIAGAGVRAQVPLLRERRDAEEGGRARVACMVEREPD